MADLFAALYKTLSTTLLDVLPIGLLIAFFQLFVLKSKVPNLRKVLLGFAMVVLGLTFFLVGLELALFPVGEAMARQLADPDFVEQTAGKSGHWLTYYWIYLFAALMGFATTIAEPSLIAVALKAEEASNKTISKRGLRVTVAFGVAFALTLGTIRIVTGTPLYLHILAGYAVVVVQTFFAPKNIIPLAYDSGGVTTSTVTVPIVTALGLGLSGTIPDRNPALDGFGLIAFASVFPIISVLGYAQVIEFLIRFKKNK